MKEAHIFTNCINSWLTMLKTLSLKRTSFQFAGITEIDVLLKLENVDKKDGTVL